MSGRSWHVIEYEIEGSWAVSLGPTLLPFEQASKKTEIKSNLKKGKKNKK